MTQTIHFVDVNHSKIQGKTPNLEKKNETKELCLAIENSSIKEVRRKESYQRNILMSLKMRRRNKEEKGETKVF